MSKNDLTIVITKPEINTLLTTLSNGPKKQLIVVIAASLFTKADVFNKIIEKCAQAYLANKDVAEVKNIQKPTVGSKTNDDNNIVNVENFIKYVTSVLFCSSVITPLLTFIDESDIRSNLGVTVEDYVTASDANWFLANILSGHLINNENIAITFIETLKSCIPVLNEVNVMFNNKGVCMPVYNNGLISLFMVEQNDKINNALKNFISAVKDIK